MRFDLEAIGDKQASRRLSRLGDRASRSRPLFEDILDELVKGEKSWWRSPRGWAPLADSTKERKARQGLPARTMRASGQLEQFLTRRGREGDQYDIGKDELRFGIPGGRHDVYYGRFHQIGKGNPRRRVVVLTTQTRRRIAKATTRHLTS